MARWAQHALYGPVPDWLVVPLDAALADLQRPIAVPVRVGFDSSTQTIWFNELGERDETGFRPFDDETEVQRLARLADYLQEQFFPETRAAWGEARPGCPGHHHPARADEMAGVAWWTCPVDGRQVAMIGRLGQGD